MNEKKLNKFVFYFVLTSFTVNNSLVNADTKKGIGQAEIDAVGAIYRNEQKNQIEIEKAADVSWYKYVGKAGETIDTTADIAEGTLSLLSNIGGPASKRFFKVLEKDIDKVAKGVKAANQLVVKNTAMLGEAYFEGKIAELKDLQNEKDSKLIKNASKELVEALLDKNDSASKTPLMDAQIRETVKRIEEDEKNGLSKSALLEKQKHLLNLLLHKAEVMQFFAAFDKLDAGQKETLVSLGKIKGFFMEFSDNRKSIFETIADHGVGIDNIQDTLDLREFLNADPDKQKDILASEPNFYKKMSPEEQQKIKQNVENNLQASKLNLHLSDVDNARQGLVAFSHILANVGASGDAQKITGAVIHGLSAYIAFNSGPGFANGMQGFASVSAAAAALTGGQDAGQAALQKALEAMNLKLDTLLEEVRQVRSEMHDRFRMLREQNERIKENIESLSVQIAEQNQYFKKMNEDLNQKLEKIAKNVEINKELLVQQGYSNLNNAIYAIDQLASQFLELDSPECRSPVSDSLCYKGYVFSPKQLPALLKYKRTTPFLEDLDAAYRTLRSVTRYPDINNEYREADFLADRMTTYKKRPEVEKNFQPVQDYIKVKLDSKQGNASLRFLLDACYLLAINPDFKNTFRFENKEKIQQACREYGIKEERIIEYKEKFIPANVQGAQLSYFGVERIASSLLKMEPYLRLFSNKLTNSYHISLSSIQNPRPFYSRAELETDLMVRAKRVLGFVDSKIAQMNLARGYSWFDLFYDDVLKVNAIIIAHEAELKGVSADLQRKFEQLGGEFDPIKEVNEEFKMNIMEDEIIDPYEYSLMHDKIMEKKVTLNAQYKEEFQRGMGELNNKLNNAFGALPAAREVFNLLNGLKTTPVVLHDFLQYISMRIANQDLTAQGVRARQIFGAVMGGLEGRGRSYDSLTHAIWLSTRYLLPSPLVPIPMSERSYVQNNFCTSEEYEEAKSYLRPSQYENTSGLIRIRLGFGFVCLPNQKYEEIQIGFSQDPMVNRLFELRSELIRMMVSIDPGLLYKTEALAKPEVQKNIRAIKEAGDKVWIHDFITEVKKRDAQAKKEEQKARAKAEGSILDKIKNYFNN